MPYLEDKHWSGVEFVTVCVTSGVTHSMVEHTFVSPKKLLLRAEDQPRLCNLQPTNVVCSKVNFLN